MPDSSTHLTPESWLSSLKLARMAALSFWTTARSSAIVFAARTFRMNCFTGSNVSRLQMEEARLAYRKSLRRPRGPHRGYLGEVRRGGGVAATVPEDLIMNLWAIQAGGRDRTKKWCFWILKAYHLPFRIQDTTLHQYHRRAAKLSDREMFPKRL